MFTPTKEKIANWALWCADRSADDPTASQYLQEMFRDTESADLDGETAAELIRSARLGDAQKAVKVPDAVPLLFRWRDALEGSQVPSTRRWVLVALSMFTGKDGTARAFPSTRRLAGYTALSRRAVEGHLRVAETEGWITRQDRPRTSRLSPSKEYALTIPLRAL